MTLKAYIFKQLLIYCMLVGISHEAALIGENVRDAQPSDELSFVVSIARKPHSRLSFRNLHFCTGTLISRKSVLTARHCLISKKVNEVIIIAGSTDVILGKKYYPQSWVKFDEWSHSTGNGQSVHDIAVIRLKGTGITNPNTSKASVMLDPTDLYNSTIRIAGWGLLENGERPLTLKTALLNVISNEECSAKNAQLGKPSYVTPNQFCSTAIPYVLSSCGDSGAPILNMKNELVGIHIGVCSPNLKGHPPEFNNLNQYNIHLYLYFYKEFIEHVRIN